MQEINLTNLPIFEYRTDWLSVTGNVPHIDYDRDKDIIFKIASKHGFSKMKDKKAFRAHNLGVEFRINKKRGTGESFLKIELQGRFFACNPSTHKDKILNIINLFWNEFKVTTPPKVSRLDVAIDIANASHTDIFPSFDDNNYIIFNNNDTKNNKIKHSKHYHDVDDPTRETAVTIQNSRYLLTCYDRIELLKFHENDESRNDYIEYYKKLYEGHDKVFRIELRLKKELCEYFNISFFADNRPLNESLKKSLAHFSHNRRIWDKNNFCYLNHIDELFHRSEYQSIKELISEVNSDINIEKLLFPSSESINSSINHIAKVICKQQPNIKQALLELNRQLANAIEYQSGKILENLNQEEKTLKLFGYTKEHQQRLQEEFNEYRKQLKWLESDNNVNTTIEEFLDMALDSIIQNKGGIYEENENGN
ncbi:hypothetical protein ABMA67_02540 [Halobacteriovorax sp. RZ-3]|uniref:hypothetical protein n=1 Tax=Halobacteriovorax sp. RZ-3 TaxID=3157720 RepID=UPI0037123DAC